jgi:hypothetical protein
VSTELPLAKINDDALVFSFTFSVVLDSKMEGNFNMIFW